MRTICTLLALLIMCTVGTSQDISAETASNFKKLEWLVGTWSGTNISKPGISYYETWEKVAQYELRGKGVTLQGQDTIFLEKISILVKDNTIYYVADVPENKGLVYFMFTEITESGFVCENPQHDFPKKITYQVEGINLKAQVSGNGKSLNYAFQKW